MEPRPQGRYLYPCIRNPRSIGPGLRELRRIPVLETVWKLGMELESRFRGSPGGRRTPNLVPSRCQRPAVEKPSGIFQTVSLGNLVNKASMEALSFTRWQHGCC